MPELIRMNHELFIKRFALEGMPRILGKVRNIFIKDFLDYIIPVQFFINFHYSSQFNYSLILHLDPIQNVTYYGSSTVIPIKYCIFLVCDAYNVIQNMSSNAKKLIGLSHKIKKEQEEIIGRMLKMEDLIQNWLRVENVIDTNEMKYLPNQILKVRNFKAGAYDDPYVYCSVTFQEIEYLKNYPGQFSEKVYLIIPCSKVPEIDTQSVAPGTMGPSNLLGPNNSSSKYSGQEITHDLGNEESVNSQQALQNKEDDKINGLSVSMSSMSSTSSRGSTSSTMQNTKSLLFSTRSPRILKLYLYIVFGVFLSFILVSSINFIIYMQKKTSVDLKIQFNQIVNKRNTYLSATLLTVKQLHLISVAPTDNWRTSSIFPMDRFTLYTNELTKNIDKLQDYHNQFKMKDQLYGSEFGTNKQAFEVFQNISLALISENSKQYSQNNTLDYGFSLFITKFGAVNSTVMMKEKIPLNIFKEITQILANNSALNSTKRQVTPLFRALFYLYENGMTSLNALGLTQEIMIQENTILTSDESKLFVNLISFISIGVITLIGIFTFPLLGKIEDRKISVLKFFNMLSSDQIGEMIQRGKDFQLEFESMNKMSNSISQRQREEEAEEDVAIPSLPGEQIENNPKNLLEPKKKVQSSKKTDTTSITNVKIGTLGRSTGSAQDISNIIKKIRQNDYNRDKREYLKRKNKEYEKMKSVQGFQVEEEIKEQEQQREVKKAKKDKKAIKKGSSATKTIKKGAKGKADQYEVRVQSVENNSSEDEKKEKKGGKEEVSSNDEEDSVVKEERKKKKNLKDMQKYDIKAQNAAINAQASNRIEQINYQVEKIALGEKIKLAFYVFFVLLFLNSCLFICFYLGQKTFQDDAKTLDNLSTFYHRENCLDNLMLYTLEQYIQNRTIGLDSDYAHFDDKFSDATAYYMKSCQMTEQSYNDLRRNLPSFLAGVSSQIDNLESSNLCKQTYSTSGASATAGKRKGCEEVYDEILKRGLTSTMFMIFNFAQQMTVRFEKEEAVGRSAKFIEERLYEGKVRDMIDLITYYIHDSLFYMDDLITQNALSYFEQLANYYLIIYCTYMVLSVVMSMIFGFVIFKKLKQQIMTSANILAIMPLEEIEQKDRHKIEQFLNS